MSSSVCSAGVGYDGRFEVVELARGATWPCAVNFHSSIPRGRCIRAIPIFSEITVACLLSLVVGDSQFSSICVLKAGMSLICYCEDHLSRYRVHLSIRGLHYFVVFNPNGHFLYSCPLREDLSIPFSYVYLRGTVPSSYYFVPRCIVPSLFSLCRMFINESRLLSAVRCRYIASGVLSIHFYFIQKLVAYSYPSPEYEESNGVRIIIIPFFEHFTT